MQHQGQNRDVHESFHLLFVPQRTKNSKLKHISSVLDYLCGCL